MNRYPDDTVTDRLDVLVRLLDAASALHYASTYPMLDPDRFSYTVGKKYARVFYNMSNGQRCVAFFVDMTTGDVYKADGWKKPTLNFARGNINTPEGRWEVSGGKLTAGGTYFYPGF